MTDYCTQEDLREHLQIDDEDDGPRLAAVIDAVSRAIDDYCGQFFYDYSPTPTARAFNATDPWRLWVPPFHTTSGLVVKSDDGGDGTYGTTWTITTDYVVKPNSGFDFSGKAVPYNMIDAVGARCFRQDMRPRVEVTARWGWAAVPDAVREAALIKCARLFRRRNTPEGFAGGGDFGMVRISKWEDPDVAMYLAPYCRIIGAPVVF